ncbi:MAG: DNA adenine methylase [Anaerolineae bacterium]|nr:DNA adenine methylase [Anaerolineae bacterium]
MKHRSPFRYPGGKTWLVPRVRRWLFSFPQPPTEFLKPFAGGAIIGLTVAAERLAGHITLVELDEQVAAVWETILEGDADWLAEEILSFNLTPETADEVLSRIPQTLKEKAFQTILRNRINHGGILASGAGRIKTGENGKGIRSRWYPETISSRIQQITVMRDRITFMQGDGLQILRDNALCNTTVYFIDPPYTAAGKRAGTRLYTYHELDHEELFAIADTLTGDFLMTYDNCTEVRRLAKAYNFDTEVIAMKNTHHAKMTELLIGRNLDWIRGQCIPQVNMTQSGRQGNL